MLNPTFSQQKQAVWIPPRARGVKHSVRSHCRKRANSGRAMSIGSPSKQARFHWQRLWSAPAWLTSIEGPTRAGPTLRRRPAGLCRCTIHQFICPEAIEATRINDRTESGKADHGPAHLDQRSTQTIHRLRAFQGLLQPASSGTHASPADRRAVNRQVPRVIGSCSPPNNREVPQHSPAMPWRGRASRKQWTVRRVCRP